MFTGLIGSQGQVVSVDSSEDGAVIVIEASDLSTTLTVADSVAVDGVCLTVAAVSDGIFTVQAVNETLRITTLADLSKGDQVNLELPLSLADRLDGHFVQGHIDGVGTVQAVDRDGFGLCLSVSMPHDLLPYVINKGSIALNGVSLTVSEVADDQITINLIPETLERTNLGKLQVGAKVNIEADLLAKYTERLLKQS